MLMHFHCDKLLVGLWPETCTGGGIRRGLIEPLRLKMYKARTGIENI